MKRLSISARPNWLDQLVSEGILWTTTEVGPYWTEAMETPKYYELTRNEQELLEKAGNEIHGMCMETVEWLINETSDTQFHQWMDRFDIPRPIRQHIRHSWNNDEWGIYGRFDFVLTKDGPKMLEYNADTPTTLIESAISQWNWFTDNQDKFKNHYQFNEIHEALVRHWSDITDPNHTDNPIKGPLHLAAFSQVDDYATVMYMAETAKEAGHNIKVIDIETIGVDDRHDFVDSNGCYIENCFKLYPWEWMMEDEYGALIPSSDTRFIEPSWKMILSNKAILALLWERYPNCQFLVPSYLKHNTPEKLEGKWVHKPLLSREGSNVTIMDEASGKALVDIEGPYGDGEFVCQKYIEWVDYDGKYPMMGVWMVGCDAVGLGIREDDQVVTQNNSRFIPHVVK